MPTVLTLLSVGNFGFLVILFVSTNSFSVKLSYHHFILGKVFQGCSWFLLALRGIIPILVSSYVGSSLLVIGFALEAIGLLSIEEFKNSRAIYYTILSFLYIISFSVFARNANQYVVISSFFVAVLYFSVSVQVLRVKTITRTRILLCSIYAATALILIARGILAAYDSSFKLFTKNFIQSITFGSTFLLLLLSGTGFILLMKERVDRMLAESMKELENLSRIDSLTGLMNRRFLDGYLTFSIPENRRRKESIAIIMIDIDFFKNYNDVYGHVAGDTCLIAVATKIKRHCSRATDLAARFGGEEFVVIMWDMNEEQAISFAEEIRHGVASLKIEHKGSVVEPFVTISLGVFAAVPENDDHGNEWFIQQADKYLYQAKKTGRNKCCSASSI
jgi:diguanylate cyclase (GGDEF) domain